MVNVHLSKPGYAWRFRLLGKNLGLPIASLMLISPTFYQQFLCQFSCAKKNYRANLWAHKRCTKHFSTKSCLCLLNVDEIDTWCQLEGLSSYLDKVPFVDPLHWQLVHILCFQGRSFPFIIMNQRFPTWGTRTSS